MELWSRMFFTARMKIKKLLYYVAKYDSVELTNYVMDALEEENIRYLSVNEGLPKINRVLMDVCTFSTVAKIMENLMNHEVRRGRLTQEDMDYFMKVFRYTCWGCLEYQPNQLAHAEPGGCLYQENGFY